MDSPPPRSRARIERAQSTLSSSSNSNSRIADRIDADPIKFLTEIHKPRGPNDGIRSYYRSLVRGAEEEVKRFPPAFVSMAGGTIHDVFRDSTDCLVCMAHSIEHGTANGMCTRPRKRQNGTVCYPIFWDLDIYSPNDCSPDDFRFMMREFLCPSVASFLNDEYHKEALTKTHYAVYFSQHEGSSLIAHQTKSKLICGMCGKGGLYRSMDNMKAYAECKLCGLRFACSSLNGGVDTISTAPFMFSKEHFLKAHRSRRPFAHTSSLVDPEPWTYVDDTNWDPETHVLKFEHGALIVPTRLKQFDAHIDKTAYKYGVHIKALNVEWLHKKRRANIGLQRNMDAYLNGLKKKPKSSREGALKYLAKIKKVIAANNQQDRAYMTPAEIQTRANAQLPTLFLTEPAHGASKEVHELDHYVAANVDTLIFTKPMAQTLCAYLSSKAIKWQESLPESNFWKTIDMGESFDEAPYVSGLRVPYAPKVMKCKHVRHRAGDAPVNCLRCDGSGTYLETERPPSKLQMIFDYKGHEVESLANYLKSNLAGQLALTTIRMPMMGTLRGTVVKETGNMRIEMANIPRATPNSRSGIPENLAVQVDQGGSWQSYLGEETEIGRRDILDPLQEWIRQLRPEWASLRVKQLKKKKVYGNTSALPQYWVNVDPRSEGVHNCPYHNGEHTGGTIYFLIQPPRTKADIKKMHGKIIYYCWSGGCPGNKCAINLRQKAHLPDAIVRRVWDPTSFVTSDGRLGALGPTLAAISRRHTVGRDVRAADIQRLVGSTPALHTPFAPVPGGHEPIPGSELILGDPPSSNQSSSATPGVGQMVPTLDPHPIASVYTAMSGDLLISCHAHLYKEFGKLCKPTDQYANIYTAMNQ